MKKILNNQIQKLQNNKNNQKLLNNQNNNRLGVSLVVLILTVVVMIIIFGAVVPGITNISSEISATEFLANMSIIEAQVAQDHAVLVGILVSAGSPMTVGTETYPSEIHPGSWYYLKENNLSELDIKNIKGTYLVNYTTGEVVSVEGVKINNFKYYTSKTAAAAIDLEI